MLYRIKDRCLHDIDGHRPATEAELWAFAEIERLRAALKKAGHYVALCPPPPAATGSLRFLLLQERAHLAEIAATLEQRDNQK
jgi:hypothetical protein